MILALFGNSADLVASQPPNGRIYWAVIPLRSMYPIIVGRMELPNPIEPKHSLILLSRHCALPSKAKNTEPCLVARTVHGCSTMCWRHVWSQGFCIGAAAPHSAPHMQPKAKCQRAKRSEEAGEKRAEKCRALTQCLE